MLSVLMKRLQALIIFTSGMSTVVMPSSGGCGGGGCRRPSYRRSSYRKRANKYTCKRYVKAASYKKRKYDERPIRNLYRYGATPLTLAAAQAHYNKKEAVASRYGLRVKKAIEAAVAKADSVGAPSSVGGGVSASQASTVLDFASVYDSLSSKRMRTDM